MNLEVNLKQIILCIDIDLLDPEVEIAATKIQAGFKGIKTRKEVSTLKGNTNTNKNILQNEVQTTK